MSYHTTWAVLCDGRYIRIMVNNGEGHHLTVLDADKNEDLAALCYKMVNSKPEFDPKGSVKAEEIDFIQLQADFLQSQYKQGLFDQLLIAAPDNVIKTLRSALSDELDQLVIAEFAEDLTAKSNDVIQTRLADLLMNH